MHVNLLPSSFVWRRLICKRLRQWGLAFSIVGVALLICNANLFGKWWRGFDEMQESQATADPIRQLQQDWKKKANEKSALEQKINQLKLVASQDHTISLLGIVANGVQVADGAVQIQEMQVLVSGKLIDSVTGIRDLQRSAIPKPTSTAEVKSLRNESQLNLRGIAIGSDSISTLMQSLQDSNVFSKVELRSTQERLVSDRTVQEFQLECISLE